MHPVLDQVLQGLLLGGAAAAQPGPFQAYLVQQAAEQGGRRALPAVLAPPLSDGPVVLLVVGGLAFLSAGVLRAVGIGGGLYLLWLAATAARHHTAPRARGLGKGILRAALVNLLAPGPYLFWGLVAGPAVLEAARRSTWAAGGFLLAFYVAMMAVNAALVLACSWASARVARLRAGLRAASVVALAGYGLYALGRGLGLLE